jgi:predicted lactoylglutathione lyase
MNKIKNLTYKPYSISINRDTNYADIVFESEGLMTIPRSSAETITNLLNSAFQKGVKMALNNVQLEKMYGSSEADDIKPGYVKSIQEEPVPINSYKKNK